MTTKIISTWHFLLFKDRLYRCSPNETPLYSCPVSKAAGYRLCGYRHRTTPLSKRASQHPRITFLAFLRNPRKILAISASNCENYRYEKIINKHLVNWYKNMQIIICKLILYFINNFSCVINAMTELDNKYVPMYIFIYTYRGSITCKQRLNHWASQFHFTTAKYTLTFSASFRAH